MTPVRDTPLFINVAPRVENLISYDELELELLRVETEGGKVKWEKMNLDQAITWAHTPQGSNFWASVHQEYDEN